jgi:hypothetical protein
MGIIFLDKEIRKLQKKCVVNKGDLLQIIDTISYLTVKKEIALEDAERYTYILFKMMETAD